MAIAMALGGFTAAQADELRRAMGHHRKAARLHAALEKLKAACVARGVDQSIAEEVVDDLHSFANYGFPESHAWSFALIAYATAYLKANYPTEFFLGMLNAWPMGFYPPATLVHDAMRHGVVVHGPCMRFGSWDCDIVPVVAAGEDVSLRSGFARLASSYDATPLTRSTALRETLSPSATDLPCPPLFRANSAEAPSVAHAHLVDGAYAPAANKKGVASDADAHLSGARIAGQQRVRECGVAELSERREAAPGQGGGERSRSENTLPHPPPAIALRIGWRHIRGLGEKTREQLQQAREDGPFESIADVVKRANLTRADALHLARAGAFEAFEPGRRKAAWEALRAAGDLLPLAPARMLPFDPMELSGQELVFLDYLATGISVNGHPMQYLRARLSDAGVASSRDMEAYRDGERIVIAGLVVARQHPETAKGTVFLLLEDEFGYMNVIVPKPMYEKYREVVKFSTFLVIEGRFQREDRVLNIVGRRFRELKTAKIIARSRDFH